MKSACIVSCFYRSKKNLTRDVLNHLKILFNRAKGEF